jgi:hypothetical protein
LKVFQINGSICQLGICCRGFPCDACQTADWDINDMGGVKRGHLQKRTVGCCKAFISGDTFANFAIHLPDGVNVETKALMMAAVILMDYELFQEQPNQQAQFSVQA